MKTRLVKNIMAPLLGVCALVTLVAAERAPKGGTVGGRLEGTWEMQLQRTDCAGHRIGSIAQAMVIFAAGGTVIESHAPRPQAQKTPGEGVWAHTTNNDYAVRFKYFTFDAQNVFTGWTIVTEELTVDETGNSNEGPATIDRYDVNGNFLESGCAELAGTRFEL